MSSSRALCCLPSVKEQNYDYFFPVQCIIKQLLDSVFVISRIIEVSVRVISLSLRLRLITPTSTSIILDITKTSSNNCLIYIVLMLIRLCPMKWSEILWVWGSRKYQQLNYISTLNYISRRFDSVYTILAAISSEPLACLWSLVLFRVTVTTADLKLLEFNT